MPERAKLNGIAPTFVVPDVVKTAEFYHDMLGFEILGYFAEPLVYAMIARDSAEIHFGIPHLQKRHFFRKHPTYNP